MKFYFGIFWIKKPLTCLHKAICYKVKKSFLKFRYNLKIMQSIGCVSFIWHRCHSCWIAFSTTRSLMCYILFFFLNISLLHCSWIKIKYDHFSRMAYSFISIHFCSWRKSIHHDTRLTSSTAMPLCGWWLRSPQCKWTQRPTSFIPHCVIEMEMRE